MMKDKMDNTEYTIIWRGRLILCDSEFSLLNKTLTIYYVGRCNANFLYSPIKYQNSQTAKNIIQISGSQTNTLLLLIHGMNKLLSFN